jgi:hypothetical protein
MTSDEIGFERHMYERYRYTAMPHTCYCARLIPDIKCPCAIEEIRKDELCLCAYTTGAQDHPRFWHDADGKLIMTVSPYACEDIELIKFISFIHSYGLGAYITGNSPYHPHTFMIIVERRD